MNGSEELKLVDSALYVDRIYKQHHKHYLSIPYKFFDSYLRKEDEKMAMNEEVIKMIKGLIDAELGK